MRRFAAGLLLAMFLFQSSGTALAADALPSVSVSGSFSMLLAAIARAWPGTTTTSSAPAIAYRPIDPGDPATEITGLLPSRIVSMTPQYGVRHTTLRPEGEPPIPGHVPLDPRAMRVPGARFAPTGERLSLRSISARVPGRTGMRAPARVLPAGSGCSNAARQDQSARMESAHFDARSTSMMEPSPSPTPAVCSAAAAAASTAQPTCDPNGKVVPPETPCPSTAPTTPQPSSAPPSNAPPSPSASPSPPTGDLTTGINPWWAFEERAIPGVGKAMANLASGNLIIQSSDLDIHERGIDLAFQRSWNSQSTHDAKNTDGTIKDVYGNGWTNPFDAHIQFNAAAGTITVYDIDGAAYTYTASNGLWAHPPGQFAILSPDTASKSNPSLSSDCGYWWTKKTGTAYFFQIADPTTCSLTKNFNGFLQQIEGRNHNDNLQLTYGWSTVGEVESLSTITVTHNDTQALTLTFAKIAGANSYTELQSITAPTPTGATSPYQINYAYDDKGNLASVTRPGNNQASTLTDNYGYAATGNAYEVCNPRAYLSNASNPETATDGDCVRFDLDGTDRVVDWIDDGVANVPVPGGDSTMGAVQPSAATGLQIYYEEWFSYGVDISNPSGGQLLCGADGTTEKTGDSATFVCDTHDHASLTIFNGDKPVQRDAYKTASDTLGTSETWDGQNQLSSTTDARGNTTNYVYDDNGNTVEVLQPAAAEDSALGSARPTSLYSYDSFNNVVAYCDPYKTSLLGLSTSGSLNPDGLCPKSAVAASGATTYDYDYSDTNEPFGRLSGSYTPMGYHTTIQYSAQSQGGDFGLPTEVKGDFNGAAFTQNDGTARQPRQAFTYDGNGNLLTYNNGSGTWTLTYDSWNRVLTTVDPDGSLSSSTPANYTSYKCYYLDGSLKYSETAIQHVTDVAAGGSANCAENAAASTLPAATRYKYDVDGDEISEVHHFGVIPGNVKESLPEGETTKFYDSLDRLVEVAQPRDAVHDMTSFAWLTRYFYDLSTSGQSVQIGTVSNLQAYGNLFKTVECLPAKLAVVPFTGSISGCTFQDVRGTTSDALDRPMAQYETAFGTTPKMTNIYDAAGDAGLLSSSKNAMGQISTHTYDEDGRTYEDTFSDSTPPRTYGYDADGRVATITSTAAWGTALQQQYDADGRLTQVQEPSGGALTNPGTMNYSYYPDGKRSTLSISLTLNKTAVSLPNAFEYSYRVDGALQTQQVNAGRGGQPNAGTAGQYSWTYTPAGRELKQYDPSNGLSFNAVSATNAQEHEYTYNVTYAARKTTYDPYGRESRVLMPVGYTESNPTYDLEGERIAYQVSSATLTPKSLTINDAYTIRGELALESTPPISNGSVLAPYNGLPIPCETGASGCGGNSAAANAGPGAVFLGYTPGLSVATFDARDDQVRSLVTGPGNPLVEPKAAPTVVDYDDAGRQTSTTSSCQKYKLPLGNLGPLYQAGSSETRSYDAENHTVGEVFGYPSSSVAGTCSGDPVNSYDLQWGLTGHPWVDQDYSYPSPAPAQDDHALATTLHWDGDSLLYEVDNGGTLNGATIPNTLTLFVGKLGWVVNPQTSTSPIATVDRDWTGSQAQWHQYDYFSSYTPPGARMSATFGGNGSKFPSFGITYWGDSLGNDLPTGPIAPGARRRNLASAATGAVVVTPDSRGFDAIGVANAKHVAVAQAKYTGAFTRISNCAGIARLDESSNAGGNADYTVTPLGSGSCTVTFTGGDGKTGTLSISVVPDGQVLVTPVTRNFNAVGSAYAKQVTVEQTNFNGAFTRSDNCAGIAQLAVVSNAGGSASYTVTPVAAGTCTVTFGGGAGLTGTLTINVAPLGPVLLSPTSLTFTAVGSPGYALPFQASQTNFNGAFSLSDDCVSSGVASITTNSNAGPTASYTVQPLAVGTCTAQITGGLSIQASLPISVTSSGPLGPPDAIGTFVTMLRPDGYQIEDLTIQGVRAYDPTTSQWTSPDAYAGDTNDPMSQKPFMWNGNSPIAYQDPSGYDPADLIARPADVLGQYHLFIEVTHSDGKKERFSFGPQKEGVAVVWPGTPLQRMPQSYDHSFSGGAAPGVSSALGNCDHACYHNMHVEAAAIDGQNRYGVVNSNTAAADVCRAGFGATSGTCEGARSSMGLPFGAGTPGWGAPLNKKNTTVPPTQRAQN